MTHAYLSSPVPLALAHRGGWITDDQGVRRTELENTAVAFQHAVDLGYTYLETDVHATADGVLMAFHDDTLDRATDTAGAIADLPYREVARARVGGREPVPLLEDLLGSWPHARFNIDLKADSAVAPLIDVLRRTGAWDRVCVGSFDQRRLDRARALFPRPVATSCGPVDVARLRVASLSPLLRPLAPRAPLCAQIPMWQGSFPVLSRDLIHTAHRLGIQVHVWTVNEPEVMEHLLDAGVDGIVTDNTTALRDVLVRRGRWTGGPVRAHNG
ncbi:glycerophosphodiester phosphodiesterase [Nocardiopsis changdeensis]|uniref:Glycerophosphodiester phosphodiesterase n=1 Tax=Nocardiopsis changdeensis TaxID=2831969 RepID=A0ABX8BD65_9ACTN|nr:MULTISPECIES: glycerophosphodiester phosphodiesterase [Nocardiopsis]QUX20191.1 glycerophosphodiester phosphodiesterase [Nocardiopsis changdeensis]QYX36119.1 glycerophosphodiester phosphodiesterase [Nocardiopsis sp. MT53]